MAVQLKMSFEQNHNHFKTNLDNGNFMVLIEVSPPSQKRDYKLAVTKAMEIEYTVSVSEQVPAALAFSDKYDQPDSVNVVDFASEVCSSSRNRHLIYLSGRGTSFDEIVENTELCKSAGFSNIVAVSGDAFPGENIKQTHKRVFTESIHTLNYLKRTDEEGHFFPGCSINPFKYTVSDCFTQYFKLMKKINQGASFIVTQAGWDMLKRQELRWYLHNRGFHYPSIARLMLLTPEKVEEISTGQCPGIHISKDFQGILENEVKFSYNQFEAAQWRRLQIQAAGCRLLGYSGIQIAGLQKASQVQTACVRINEALEEFKTFEEWKEAYYAYLARTEMAPYPHRFYVFDKLFEKAHPEKTPRMNRLELPKPSVVEKLRYCLSRMIFSDANRRAADEHLISKKILSSCRKCAYCRLPLTSYVCPENCPKKLSNGACGGTKADGYCEVGNHECIHSQRLRLAAWQKEIDSMEERYIRSADSE